MNGTKSLCRWLRGFAACQGNITSAVSTACCERETQWYLSFDLNGTYWYWYTQVHGILSENDIDNAALAPRSDLFQLWATRVAGRVENEFITPKKKIRKCGWPHGTIFSRPYYNGRAYATVLRPSVCRLLSVTYYIMAKRCVLEQKLLLTAYKKSHMRNRLLPKWMTLTFV